ncbi:MAG: glutamine-hydrolyzing carbamoyl-phosphate synthase small subunit [Nitrosomonadales bacterium]|mgnify:FL=1|nr:glutamine-hydrolyzing carbamoyl-phosphate synthase small subunit [Nitrosomonadales bacterium]
MASKLPAILVLADGTKFRGFSIGASGNTVGEVVFNTSMTGYQEIISDPSYADQIISFTYPHIGNVGINEEDFESNHIYSKGIIIHDLPFQHSNFRSNCSLSEFLIKKNIVSIAGIDTRSLTTYLRTHGAQSGCILAGENIDEDYALKVAKEFNGLLGSDLAQKVTSKTSYNFNESEWSLGKGFETMDNQELNVVAYDFGIKKNILRMLVSRGCNVTVVPAKTGIDDVMALKPDGIFLSNGPGDPEPCEYAINNIKVFLKKEVPIFGICLGHQLLALASGAKTEKMKFGHHGANHPVRDIGSGKIFITSQNHGFSVDPKSLSENLKITHLSLFDGSLQGIERTDVPAFGFQGHPEASPGPTEMSYLFDRFITMIKQFKDRK